MRRDSSFSNRVMYHSLSVPTSMPPINIGIDQGESKCLDRIISAYREQISLLNESDYGKSAVRRPCVILLASDRKAQIARYQQVGMAIFHGLVSSN
jgi:hypothetical protein